MTRFLSFLALFAMGCLGGLSAEILSAAEAASPSQKATAADPITFGSHLKPFFSEYCIACHGKEKQKAALNLEVFGIDTVIMEDRKTWEKVMDMLESREMPPEKKPQPSEDQRQAVIRLIDSELAKLDCSGPANPGRVTIRRLNRTEYNNTIRDLLGVDFKPAADFPSDEVGYGFDNIGDVLSLSPILMEKYLAAAEQIVTKAIAVNLVNRPEVDGPGRRGASRLPETHKRLIPHEPSPGKEHECAKDILAKFARRAYRRPVLDEEVERLARFIEIAKSEKGTFEEGIQLAVQAVLTSPFFLFRWELDPHSTTPGTVRPLSDYEVASRLSYFLWSSMPDDELFALAEQEKLAQPHVLEAQVKRMLKDSKATALVESFASQWLTIRNLDIAAPDPELFPNFDERLRTAMRRETELFFEAILREDRSVLEFLEADFTFVNERLARHYGLEAVKGEQFQRVSLPRGSGRGGLLTQASILTITSNPTRTSPVSRGKWILEQILGAPPPPPPPDVPELAESKKAVESGSLRQRLEQHRANPDCAVCHNKMDPLGFAFENFDAIGAWRSFDGKFPIDSSGKLPSGQTFNGPEELKAILKSQGTFVRALVEKMLTFALGRGLEYYDKCAVDDICKAVVTNNYKFSTLVTEIVKSEPFLMRKKEGDPK